jgi:hypothetical protein
MMDAAGAPCKACTLVNTAGHAFDNENLDRLLAPPAKED